MTDIADLVAKLDALEKAATPGPWKFRHREHDWGVELGAGEWHGEWCQRRLAEMIDPDKGWHDAAIAAELRNNWPRLRAIVVAAQAYVEASEDDPARDIDETYFALVAAVRGEA